MKGILSKAEWPTVIGILVVAIAALWFGSAMEAKTYNRLTGSDVTTWEAVWVQLRLDGDR